MVDWTLIGYGVGGGLAAVILPRFLLCCIGFTCCGVRKGSCASASHSNIGNVESGSCFAVCQSVGAVGFPCCINFMLFILGFVITVFLVHMGSTGAFNFDWRNLTADGNITIYSKYFLALTPVNT